MSRIGRTPERVEFADAVRTASHVCVALSGLPGAGKTLSALRLATGLTGGEGIFVIDADNNRTLQYADRFRFRHTTLRAPFAPVRFAERIDAAIRAGARCVIVDPLSNEWEGDGGVLEMMEGELDRMAGDDFGKRDRMKFTAWIKPKAEHKALCALLEQAPCHLVLLYRAHPKMQLTKDDRGRVKVQEPDWTPVTEKRLAAFATISLMLKPNGQGRPDLDEVNTKLDGYAFGFIKSQEQITEATGEMLAAWARGESPREAKPGRAARPARKLEDSLPNRGAHGVTGGGDDGPVAPAAGQEASRPEESERPDDSAAIFDNSPTEDKHILALRRFLADLAAVKTMAEYQAVALDPTRKEYLAKLAQSSRANLYAAVAPRIADAYSRATQAEIGK